MLDQRDARPKRCSTKEILDQRDARPKRCSTKEHFVKLLNVKNVFYFHKKYFFNKGFYTSLYKVLFIQRFIQVYTRFYLYKGLYLKHY